MTPEFLADLLQAILDGDDDDEILAILDGLKADDLQNLSYAGIRLARFCRDAFGLVPGMEVEGEE